ncbi:hypothetical protein TREPR_0228 [Treponema primitia ZAS-2]|uniref:Uncharacterized protein n=1 Tax=Treponema primitia (strain ATCC BAA-887 / DSM 12427 / ZAS-2) TaxID=545694 RepID=F5YLL8_TREPZ|nr:hypothetical protein [Treponema primitia]AEF84804.1 hypothetical protein TREPR_0228 [Treponema primitia ZAS-2]
MVFWVHYKKKKDLFYDGSEGWEELSSGFEGIGAAFLLIDISIPSLRIGRGKSLYFGIGKVLAIPWGYEIFSLDNEENTGGTDSSGGGGSGGSGGSIGGGGDSGSGDQSQWLRTIFLSGLSLNIKLIIN